MNQDDVVVQFFHMGKCVFLLLRQIINEQFSLAAIKVDLITKCSYANQQEVVFL